MRSKILYDKGEEFSTVGLGIKAIKNLPKNTNWRSRIEILKRNYAIPLRVEKDYFGIHIYWRHRTLREVVKQSDDPRLHNMIRFIDESRKGCGWLGV